MSRRSVAAHLDRAAQSARPYFEVVSGSIPLFPIASDARVDARNSISRLAPSVCPEPATVAAENTWMNCMPGAMRKECARLLAGLGKFE